MYGAVSMERIPVLATELCVRNCNVCLCVRLGFVLYI